MINVCIRPRRAAVAAVSALAATTGKTSSDEILVEQIAAGSRPAMQALFARHRTHVYRGLLRFVSNETLAEDLLSEVFLDVWRQAGRFQCLLRLDLVNGDCPPKGAVGTSPPDGC